ncbi:hypothetical protein QBC32DRAFT_50023 [Pseudoneurospora amorphoporcata]|uniref:Uncharacterized protein n=1 Tax=Pseudoneurospora amorphoporcata TaxID=241081 RepID=A0AAN6NRY2_9PEZI|nr:hypothetical protein QBC32DRAFT_50023 [Pseudoneurospora amorphoporcata]
MVSFSVFRFFGFSRWSSAQGFLFFIIASCSWHSSRTFRFWGSWLGCFGYKEGWAGGAFWIRAPFFEHMW